MIISDEDITSGTITATIKFGPFPYQQKFDLCSELSEVGTTCPINKGPLNLSVGAKIPHGTPKVGAANSIMLLHSLFTHSVYLVFRNL